MEKGKTFKAGEETASGFTIDNTLNREDGALPYGYFEPSTEGKLTWICGEGPPQKGKSPDIISIFEFDKGNGQKERDVKRLETLDDAKFCRDELIKAGWQKLIPPNIEFTMKGSDKPLNRKQKRYMEKKFKNFAPKDY